MFYQNFFNVYIISTFLYLKFFLKFPENFCKVSLKLHPRPFNLFFFTSQFIQNCTKIFKRFQIKFSSFLKMFHKIHSVANFLRIYEVGW